MRSILTIVIALLIASQAQAQTDLYHDNVVVVVDGSGSMGDSFRGTKQEKMALAKEALKTV